MVMSLNTVARPPTAMVVEAGSTPGMTVGRRAAAVLRAAARPLLCPLAGDSLMSDSSGSSSSAKRALAVPRGRAPAGQCLISLQAAKTIIKNFEL